MSQNKFLIFCFVLLIAPALQRSLATFKEASLAGVEGSCPPQPELSLGHFLSAAYQKGVDCSLNHGVGFRGLFIRSYNQINFTLFGEGPGELIIGKDGYLFEEDYLEAYRDEGKITSFRPALDRLAFIASELRARGQSLVFLLTASKPETYPEKIPVGFPHPPVDPSRKNRDYDLLLKEIAARDIAFVDGQKLAVDLKAEGWDTFPPTGTHVSLQTACATTQALVRTLQGDHPDAIEFDCLKNVERTARPRGTDHDLNDLLSVWVNHRIFPIKYAYPQLIGVHAFEHLHKPLELTLVGGSFLFPMIQYLFESDTVHAATLLYYYKKIIRYPGRIEETQTAEAVEKDLRKSSALVYELNISRLDELNTEDFLFDMEALLWRVKKE